MGSKRQRDSDGASKDKEATRKKGRPESDRSAARGEKRFQWGLVAGAMVPAPRRNLDLSYRGNAEEAGLDRVAHLATMLSIHWSRFSDMPTGTRASAIDQLIREMMADTREKRRTNPRTRSKRDLVRARYVAECEQAGALVSRPDFAQRVAPEFNIQPETVASYLTGLPVR
jgi:hypothetical protein